MLDEMVKIREKDINLVEYDRFLEKLSELTENEKTKEKIKNLRPFTEKKDVLKAVSTAGEFIDIVNKEGYFPLTEYPDIEDAIGLLSIEESILSSKEILDIGKILKTSRDIKKMLSPYIKEKEYLLPLYRDLFSSREIERIISDSIDSSGMVKDSASRDLLNIRKSIKEVEKTLISILEGIINSYKYQDIIQEKIITVRKDRYVIPVKQNFSSKIKGIIHDRSSSGQTVYIEPVNVVELNNRLSDLKIREHIEIRKILKFLTDILRNRVSDIRKTFDAVVQFDYLYTVYRFSSTYKCVFPEISDELYLIDAKHPLFLMNSKKFIPIDVRIEEPKKGLVITGPNTGGKTVTLKTAGILPMIFQTGIPIPVSEGSKIPVFDWIYADIGDMQSIEHNLSTYSAHIKNIQEILERITERSLVLLDELIPGTDPDEGSAIGIGIMEKIKEKNAYCMVTTHFKQIKMFALSDDYFEVASVGFDRENLSPTYKVHYRSVGQSMAFYIAEKLGFDEDILSRARKYLPESAVKLSEAIEKLERYKDVYEKEHSELIELKKRLKMDQEKYSKLVKELEEEKKKRWKSASKEIEAYIERLREEGYRILDEIRKKPSGKDLERFIIQKKRDVENLIPEEDQPVEHIDIGDTVKLKGKNTVGEVISVREDKANVNFNGIKIWVRLSELEKVEKKTRESSKKFRIKKSVTPVGKPELKLIGKTKEEALKELSDFMDRAIIEGFTTVRIIHGYGSGILRKVVREYLDKLPYSISYEDAPYHEGGMGVTVVHIK
ncbi:endonuclease MutS2 [Persephonella sp.]